MTASAPGRPSVTIQTFVDAETAAELHRLYVDSFAELTTRAVARQVLHEDEFHAMMIDERVDKYLARDDLGGAVAMCTLTRHLETVPWISPAYFLHHYPEHAARDAIYYLAFILVSPQHRRARVFREMVRLVARTLVDRRALCGYDICGYNGGTLGLAGTIGALLGQVAEIDVRAVDTQVYYAAVPVIPHQGA